MDVSRCIDRMVESHDVSVGGSNKDYKTKLKSIKKSAKTKKKKNKTVNKVTEHAVVRYVERVMGINVDTIKKGLGRFCKKGDGRHFLDSGISVVVKGGRVVTVVSYKENER